MPKATLSLSPMLIALRDEAERMGVSFPALLTADLARLRQLAEAATPELGDWQWSLLSHVLSGAEAHRLLTGDDSLPSPALIVAEIDMWADGATEDEMFRAGELTRDMANWAPLTVAGVLLRLRRRA